MRRPDALRFDRLACSCLTSLLPLVSGLAVSDPERAMSRPAGRQAVDTVVRTAGRPVHPGVATLVEEVSIGVATGADRAGSGGEAAPGALRRLRGRRDVARAGAGSTARVDRGTPG